MICNSDGALYNFRGPIIKKLVSEGHEVVTISSCMGYIDSLVGLGVKTHIVEFVSHSTNVWTNLRIAKQLYQIIKDEKPDVVHSFTHKAAIYGTLAAKLSQTKKVFITITGLGTLFSYEDFRTRILRLALILQYRVAARLASGVFFQNPDDNQYFKDWGLVSSDRAIQTYGSGISLEDNPIPSAEKIVTCKDMLAKELNMDLTRKLIILFPARALKEKGFLEFYDGARRINSLTDDFVFVHLGSNDQGAKYRVSSDTIESYSAASGVHYLGFKENISDYMIASDIVALPSYREGVPHSLIEALVFDKFIVTTDAPGCKETVIDGWNGFLCKPRDTDSFVQAILKVQSGLLQACTNRSRQHCEEKFDVAWLLETTYRHYFGDTDGK